MHSDFCCGLCQMFYTDGDGKETHMKHQDGLAPIFDGPYFIEDCPEAVWDDVIADDIHYRVFADRFAVTEGHRLFVPKYNTVAVLSECMEAAVYEGQAMVEQGYCHGFNIGLNYGTAAGQTIPWPHVHLIPRRTGDVENPTGGVRNVIPGKGCYKG